MDDILKSYIEDLKDNLLLFNESLMSFESDKTDSEVINGFFRVAHTIKGNSAAMEFLKVEKVMHAMEDILYEVRENTHELTQQVIDIMYHCHDFLEDFLEVLLNEGDDKKMDTNVIMNELNVVKKTYNNDKDEAIKETAEPSYNNSKGTGDSALSALPEESLEIIKQNIQMGLFAKHIMIELNPKTIMKSIRVFMLLKKIEVNATLAYSDPKMPTEEEFRSGEFDFEGDIINVVVFCEHSLEELLDELEQESDIEFVNIKDITKEDLSGTLEVVDIKNFIECIENIEINVLAFEENDNNEEVFNKTLKWLGKLTKINKPSMIVLNAIATRLEAVLQYISVDFRGFTADIVKLIIEILDDMKLAAKAHEGASVDAQTIKHAESGITKMEEIYFGIGEKTGEILERKGLLQKNEVEIIAAKQEYDVEKLKFGQIAVKDGKVSASEMADVLKEQSQQTKKSTTKNNNNTNQIRIPVTKIDNLMDMLGEVVILSSQLEEQVGKSENADSNALNSISRMTKIVRNIQDLSMSLRLITIKDTLFRLTRVVRDTASELDKKVNFSIMGEDTELDRSAAEKLFDPLMHLVRNAVSHGIESSADRIRAGKPEKGTVEIKAYSKRGHVYVEVNDDGQGINPDKVLKKAIINGLADPTQEYSELEIVNFIMKPGFSTQEEINNIAGRGVGLNVVESELAKIGGKVQIINNYKKGCSFVLRIPMNLALINGTVVVIRGETYVIPTLFIQQFYIQAEKDWLSIQGRKRAIDIRGDIISLVMPEEVLDIDLDEEIKRDKIVVLDMDNQLVALPVDDIVGRREVVAKPLEQDMVVDGVFTGASILGDGKVALILDVEAIFKLMEV